MHESTEKDTNFSLNNLKTLPMTLKKVLKKPCIIYISETSEWLQFFLSYFVDGRTFQFDSGDVYLINIFIDWKLYTCVVCKSKAKKKKTICV